jgi:hypothetical protein
MWTSRRLLRTHLPNEGVEMLIWPRDWISVLRLGAAQVDNCSLFPLHIVPYLHTFFHIEDLLYPTEFSLDSSKRSRSRSQT